MEIAAPPEPANTDSLRQALEVLQNQLPSEYILVGGASLVQLGSERMTKDIDILIPEETSAGILQGLSNHFSIEDGNLFLNTTSIRIPIDMLTNVIGYMTFHKLKPFTMEIACGRVLTYPVALGVKIRCHYMRDDESQNGINKQFSDIDDIIFISKKMKELKLKVNSDVAALIPVNCYNMLLVRSMVGSREEGASALFEEVGGSRFEVKWEDNTDDQRQYYLALKAELEEEEDEESTDRGGQYVHTTLSSVETLCDYDERGS